MYDLLREDRDADLEIKNPLDVKKIYHRDADLDEGWYEFDVTGAVSRWIRKGTRKTQVRLMTRGSCVVPYFCIGLISG